MSLSKQQYLSLCTISLLVGILFIAWQQNFIILNFKTGAVPKLVANQNRFFKQTTTLHFWQDQRWRSEQNDIIWSNDPAHNITNLVQNWLELLHEQNLIPTQIKLQSVLITPNQQTAYLSFDKPLFNFDASSYEKLLLIEGLLKTIRTNQIAVPFMQILVQQEILNDMHLDFANPWPLNGFLSL